MNSNVTISLDTRRPKQDGSFPVILRLSHKRKTIGIATGFSVPRRYWDIKSRTIKNSYKGLDNITRLNNYILKTKAEAMDVITKLKENGDLPYLTVKQVKDAIVTNNKKVTVFQFTQGLIDTTIQEKRIGNARCYKNVLREIKKFRNNRDFYFDELNYEFLKRFESSYLARGNSENGLSVYMRTLRAIFNKAINANLVDKEAYPFNIYSIKSKPTRKRAISYHAIQKIVDLEFTPGQSLFDARNIFLMSFYLMGAPFTDLALLKVGNIVDGRIKYQRKKTGKFYDIGISSFLQSILDYYLKNKTKEEYILPIIKHDSLINQHNDILWALQRHNKLLKRIAQLAGIEENLTSYVSRHSFATIPNNMAVPVTAISQMLGHQKLSTTQIYLAGLNKDLMDEYNLKIITGK